MTVLVVGASGATGRQLVSQLLKRGLKVKIIVRRFLQIVNIVITKDCVTHLILIIFMSCKSN